MSLSWGKMAVEWVNELCKLAISEFILRIRDTFLILKHMLDIYAKSFKGKQINFIET